VAETVKDLREKHGLEDKKKLSRNERRRQAREALERENETLRQQLGDRTHKEASPKYDPSTADAGAIENSLRFAADKHGTEKLNQAYSAFVEYVQQSGDKAAYNHVMSSPDIGDALIEWHDSPKQTPQQPSDPYHAALEEGRQDVRFQHALAEMESTIRVQTEAKVRAAEFAKSYPDFHEQMEQIKWIETIPSVMADMIHRSEFGPAIGWRRMLSRVTAQSFSWNSWQAILLHKLA
jgi:hypothetical protein